LEKTVNSENLRNALVKSKDITINLLGKVLFQTRVEPIRDADGIKGLKARWVSEHGENSMEIHTPSGSADIIIDSNTAPTVEYVEDGERRTIAIRHIENLSCELDRETLDRIATPRGAGLAMGIGAGIGLLGWFLISVMRSLAVARDRQTADAIPTVVSEEDSNQSIDPTSE
jgi:hypothetical protein